MQVCWGRPGSCTLDRQNTPPPAASPKPQSPTKLAASSCSCLNDSNGCTRNDGIGGVQDQLVLRRESRQDLEGLAEITANLNWDQLYFAVTDDGDSKTLGPEQQSVRGNGKGAG